MFTHLLNKFFRRKRHQAHRAPVEPLGRAFFLDGELVGLLKRNAEPREDGAYGYMAVRGPGHLKMIQMLSAGVAVCTCSNDKGGFATFTVTSVTPPSLLHIRLGD